MKRLILSTIFILFCTNLVHGVVGSPIALWSLESGAFTVDSEGGNTLTEGEAPDAETGDYKEGSSCADFTPAAEGGDSLYIADGDLDADFPLKNGVGTQKITFCCWCKFDTLPTNVNDYRILLYKLDTLQLAIRKHADTNTYFCFDYSTDGSSWEGVTYHASAVAVDTWYHFAFGMDSDGDYKMRIWDDTAQDSFGADIGDTASAFVPSNETLYISYPSTQGMDGLIDEVLIYDDYLDDSTIDQIREGKKSQVIIIQ